MEINETKTEKIIERFGEEYGVKKSLEEIVTIIFGIKNSRELISKKQIKFDGEIINKSSVSYYGKPNKTITCILKDEEITVPILPTILIMNKPLNCETTVVDTNHKTVMNYLQESKLYNPKLHSKVVPIGRLDLNSTGLLIFTNDGLLLNCMLIKESHLPKTYCCFLEKEANQEDIEAFSKGINIPLRQSKSRNCLPCKAEIIAPKIVELTICEGAHHQVKRMWIERGNRVIKLERISIGPIQLNKKELDYGEVRMLTPKEQIELYKSVNMQESFFAKSISL